MNTDTAKSEPIELGFLLKWISLSTIGWIVVSAIPWIVVLALGWSVLLGVYIPQFRIDQEFTSWVLTWLVCGVVGGAIGGIFQWFALRGRLSQLGAWVVAPIWIWSAILCYALGSTMAGWWIGNDILPFSNVVIFLGLALTGIAQWFVLKRYVSKASWLLIVAPIGITVSLVPVIFFLLFGPMYDVGFWWYDDIKLVIKHGAVLGAIGGVVFGTITTIALYMLLRPMNLLLPSSELKDN